MKVPLFSLVPPELLKPVERFRSNDPPVERAYKNGRIQGELAARALIEHYDATHDDLTGLLNKKALKQDVAQRVEAAQNGSGSKEFGVFFADITNFKKANDVLGHERVDRLLKEFAPRLNKALRTKKDRDEHFVVPRNTTPDKLAHERLFEEVADEAGRYGGDEIAGAVDLTPTEEAGKAMSPQDRLYAVATRVRDVFHEFISEQELAVQTIGNDIAVGVSLYHDGMSAEQLFSEADTDMSIRKNEQHAVLGKYRDT